MIIKRKVCFAFMVPLFAVFLWGDGESAFALDATDDILFVDDLTTDSNLAVASSLFDTDDDYQVPELQTLNTLTLEEVLASAISISPDVALAKEKLVESGYDLDLANAVLYPTVNIEVATGKERTDGDNASEVDATRSQFNIDSSYSLYDFGRNNSDIKRVEYLKDVALAKYNDVVEATMFKAAVSYVIAAREYKKLEISKRNLSVHQNIRDLVKKRADIGGASNVDVRQAEAQLLAADADIIAAKARLKDALDVFEVNVGLRVEGRLSLPPSITPTLSTSVEEAVAIAYENNRQSKIIQLNELSLAEGINVRESDLYPKISIESFYNRSHNSGGDVGIANDARVMLTLNYSLYDGGAARAMLNQARSKLLQSKMENRGILDDIKIEVMSQYNSQLTANERTRSLELKVDAGSELTSVYVERFQAGGVSLLDVLQVHREHFLSQTELETVKAEMYLSGYSLLKAMGTLLSFFEDR